MQGTKHCEYHIAVSWMLLQLSASTDRSMHGQTSLYLSTPVMNPASAIAACRAHIKLGRAGQGRAGQGRAGQGRAGRGRAGQGRAEQGRAGQEREGRASLSRKGSQVKASSGRSQAKQLLLLTQGVIDKYLLTAWYCLCKVSQMQTAVTKDPGGQMHVDQHASHRGFSINSIGCVA